MRSQSSGRKLLGQRSIIDHPLRLVPRLPILKSTPGRTYPTRSCVYIDPCVESTDRNRETRQERNPSDGSQSEGESSFERAAR